MIIEVFKDHIEILQKDGINKNEYNINHCYFNFDSAYDNLIKKALFTNAKRKTYEMLINENQCEIPTEVLNEIGLVLLGVYAYESEDNTLVLRYSPKPSTFFVQDGSYKEDIENSSIPTPTQVEQIEQALYNMEAKIENGDFDGVGIENITFNPDYTITDETLISQLDAIENAMSTTGTTTIAQTNADLPFIISASALKPFTAETLSTSLTDDE